MGQGDTLPLSKSYLRSSTRVTGAVSVAQPGLKLAWKGFGQSLGSGILSHGYSAGEIPCKPPWTPWIKGGIRVRSLSSSSSSQEHQISWWRTGMDMNLSFHYCGRLCLGFFQGSCAQIYLEHILLLEHPTSSDGTVHSDWLSCCMMGNVVPKSRCSKYWLHNDWTMGNIIQPLPPEI